jgi:hypothetical protein
MYPLSTNLHVENVAGCGFCLFYNTLGFLTLVTILVATATTIIWATTPSHDILQMETCRITDAKDFASIVGGLLFYRKVAAIAFGIVWICVFFLSVHWACFQRDAFRELDNQTSLMADFGLRVNGLPKDATEKEIADFFDHLVPHALVGISLAYNYKGKEKLIEKSLERHLRVEEWKAEKASSEGSSIQDLEPQSVQDRDLLIDVLRGLQGSGVAFAVCHTEALREQVIERFQAPTPRGGKAGKLRFRGKPIYVSCVQEEPCCFYWENFIYTRYAQLAHGAIEIGVLLIILVVLGIVVYWPAAHYIFNHLVGTGSDSVDVVVMMLGFGISLMNCIMYILVDLSARRVGFYYKVDVDICNLVGCTAIVGAQTFFNLVVAFFAVKSVDLSMSPSLFSEQSREEGIARTESEHAQMAVKLWNLLVPGVLVIPDLLGRLCKYVLSAKAMFNYYVQIPFAKRDLRTNANVTQWEANSQLLPGDMQVEFDYSNNICMTSTAFAILFFNTSYAVWTCWILVSWVILSYITLKYCHLRFNKVIEYTSSYLDDCSIVLWGIPLSIIASASAYWAAAWKHWPWWITPAAFGVSLLLYWLAIALEILF